MPYKNMEYRIEEKKAFTIIGYGRDIPYAQCYAETPKFWDVFHQRENPLILKGVFGLCQMHQDAMHYLIGDVYLPWMKLEKDMETFEIPASRWVVFPVHGALPDALQKVNSEVWQNWVPAHREEYPIKEGYSIEMYTPPVEDMSQYYCEIWVPLQ